MPSSQDRPAATALVAFIHQIGRLKSTPRTGWLDRDVPPAETESVADHSFRLALLAWLAALVTAPALDADRVLKMALIHDLAEALTGDEPPYDAAAIPAADAIGARHQFLQQRHQRDPARAAAKRAAEEVAMASLLDGLPPVVIAEIAPLWREYLAQETPEAVFVKQTDRLETYFQAREYLAQDPSRPMASFATEVEETIIDSSLQDIRAAIAALLPTHRP